MSEEAVPGLSRIYETYHDKVVSYAARLIGREEADDVAQEVFLKIGRSLGTLVDRAKMTSWIYAITLNTVRDAARARASRVDRPLPGADLAAESGEGGAAEQRQRRDGSRTPEEIAMRGEMIACYLGYVKQLPPEYLEVYVLSEFEALASEEIAERLSVSVGAVKIRLHRARARLNEELRRNCQCYYNERGELMGEPKRP